jgi:histidine triad (HIT) family protein
MATIFTRIIDGELPGRFVWRDERVVAFLSINPLGPGHTLVVPVQEVDHWVDADEDLLAHVHLVGHRVARAIREVFQPPRVAVIIAGFEVPHMHVHYYPAWGLGDLSFANAEQDPDQARMDRDAEALRAALRAAGHGGSVPA